MEIPHTLEGEAEAARVAAWYGVADAHGALVADWRHGPVSDEQHNAYREQMRATAAVPFGPSPTRRGVRVPPGGSGAGGGAGRGGGGGQGGGGRGPSTPAGRLPATGAHPGGDQLFPDPVQILRAELSRARLERDQREVWSVGLSLEEQLLVVTSTLATPGLTDQQRQSLHQRQSRIRNQLRLGGGI